MKSYNKPTNEELDRVMPLLSSPQHEAYFFSRLESPMWIAPLYERGLFRDPPEPEQVKEGGVRFPQWPPSGYLARMAAQASAEVAAIFAKIETQNPSVIGDMLKSALVMPPDVAVSLVPAVCRAALQDKLWIYFKNA